MGDAYISSSFDANCQRNLRVQRQTMWTGINEEGDDKSPIQGFYVVLAVVGRVS